MMEEWQRGVEQSWVGSIVRILFLKSNTSGTDWTACLYVQ